MKTKEKEKRSVFLALGVCLLAIGVACFGTYSSVSDYIDFKNDKSDVSNAQDDPQPNRDQGAATNDTGEDLTSKNSTDSSENSKTEDEKDDTSKDDEDKSNSSNGDTSKLDVNVTSSKEPEENEAVTTNKNLSEKYQKPIESTEIINQYSPDVLVYNETMKDYRVHKGVDIKATAGETVTSVNNGLVKSTFNDLLLGNVIIVEYGDFEVWYCGLGATFLVNEGEKVSQGQDIGSIKEVPFEKGDTHLHFEVYKDGKNINPNELGIFE